MKLDRLKMFLVAGAMLVLMGTANIFAQADALVDMLQKKGLLTQREANEVKEQMFTDIRDQMPGTKIRVGGWLDELKLSGDVRLRYDSFFNQRQLVASGTSAGTPNGGSQVGFDSRARYRYRLRFGAEAKAGEFTAGLRLASGDSTGPGSDPVSTNTTFDNAAGKKNVNIDQAYLAWEPSWGSIANAKFIGGKIENPFWETALVFDPDLTPEGFAETFKYKPADSLQLFVNLGQFVVEENAPTAVAVATPNSTGTDIYLIAEQLGVNWDITPKVMALKTAAGLYQYTDMPNAATSATTAGNPGWNALNSLSGAPAGAVAVQGPRASDYNIVTVNSEYRLTLGKFLEAHPLILFGEIADNVTAPQYNMAWEAGVRLGELKKKGDWTAYYGYEWLEANAVYDEWTDSDFGYGGTNKKGHLVKLGYNVTDYISVNLSYWNQTYINESVPGFVNPTAGAAAPGAGPASSTQRFQADVVMKF